jgi:tetratricopeptide (TPR) repeat protein
MAPPKAPPKGSSKTSASLAKVPATPPTPPPPAPPEDAEAKDRAKDRAHWAAVDEATELLHEERYREALTALRDVATRDPKNPYAYYFLGVALFEMGELETARDAYRASLRIAPKHLGARVSLTHVLRQLGDLREALKEGTTALSQAPGDGDALHAVGLVYLARGDDAAARRYFEAFLETNPELETAMEVRGILDGLDKGLS